MKHRSGGAIALVLFLLGGGPILGALEGSVQFGVFGDYDSIASPAFSGGPETAVSISTFWFPDQITGLFLDAAASAYYDPFGGELGTAVLVEPALSIRGPLITMVLDAPLFFGAQSTATSPRLAFSPRLALSAGAVEWALELAPSASLNLLAESGNVGADLTGSLLIGAVSTLDARIGVYHLYGTTSALELSGGTSFVYFAPGGVELNARADVYHTVYETTAASTSISVAATAGVPVGDLLLSGDVPVVVSWTEGASAEQTAVTVSPQIGMAAGLGDGVSLASDLTSSLRFVGATLDRWSLGLSVDLRFGFGE